MRSRLLALAVAFAGLAASRGVAQSLSTDAVDHGAALFAQHCAACHQLTTDSFGPPLGGITRLLSTEELLAWIGDPATVLAGEHNPRAQALLARYKAPMPPFSFLGDDGLRALVAYLAAETERLDLAPHVVDTTRPPVSSRSLIAPVVDSGIVIELEDFVQVPRLPDRPAYKGIALLRPDPRDEDDLIVSDLMGLLYRIRDGMTDVYFDLRPDFPDLHIHPGVGSGLSGFAFHPDFLRNGLLYTLHSEVWAGEEIVNPADVPAQVADDLYPQLAWVLTEWRAADPRAARFAGSHREVMRWGSATFGHGGQEIAFAPTTGPDDPDYGLLYLSEGDGGSINAKLPNNTGHPRSLMGTIMRIDPQGTNGPAGRYGIPPDNPFAGATDPTIRQEIWATGFRNAHRFSWDILPDGRKLMIAADIGESTVEEINLVEPGANYGWGVGRLEGSARIDITTDPTAIFPATAAETAPYRLPHGEYHHEDGTAVTGGYVYHGPIELLQGKYVFGDIVNGRIFYMNIGTDLEDHTIYELRIVRAGELTSVKALSSLNRAHLRVSYDPRHGELYVMTKDDGMIRRVTTAYYR